VTNCAGAGLSETLWVSATNPISGTSTAEWILWSGSVAPCELGLNQFHLNLEGTGFSALVVGPSPADFGVIPDGVTAGLQLSIAMPCQGSDGQGETMAFNVNFLVTFP
jgi:hypothetical protein